jgi:hypothetical protein
MTIGNDGMKNVNARESRGNPANRARHPRITPRNPATRAALPRITARTSRMTRGNSRMTPGNSRMTPGNSRVSQGDCVASSSSNATMIRGRARHHAQLPGTTPPDRWHLAKYKGLPPMGYSLPLPSRSD